MNKSLIFGLLLALVGSVALATTSANKWTIGPHIRGKNYSIGMPLQPEPTQTGWTFDFPYPNRSAGHVHYVSFAPDSLVGKARIVVNYRVYADRDTRFVPQDTPGLSGTVSLVIQRRGDTWNARGRFEHYRWYSPDEDVQKIMPGVHRMVVELDNPRWISVWGKRMGVHRSEFRVALAQAGRVGLVFGSAGGRGHGVFSTAPARFELLSFEVE